MRELTDRHWKNEFMRKNLQPRCQGSEIRIGSMYGLKINEKWK